MSATGPPLAVFCGVWRTAVDRTGDRNIRPVRVFSGHYYGEAVIFLTKRLLFEISILLKLQFYAIFGRRKALQSLPIPIPRPSKIKLKSIENPCGKKHVFSKQIFVAFSQFSTSKSKCFGIHFACRFQESADNGKS